MQTLFGIIEKQFKPLFIEVGLAPNSPVVVVDASRPEFGDYQVNGIMQAAKKVGKNPREIATQIVDRLKGNAYFEKVEVAGPGFINLKINPKYLASYIASLDEANHFGVIVDTPQTIVVDLSSPNLAKEMHVGHLRSTLIGDSLGRIFTYLGNRVILQNHVGDWGTQFGMLIAYLEMIENDKDTKHKINDLEEFYRSAKICFDQDEAFANKAREYVVILQNHKKHGQIGQKIYNYWQEFCSISLTHCEQIYATLKVNLTKQNMVGESFYNERLNSIIKRLEDKNLVVESDDAKCVFFAPGELDGGEETPFIVQKKDGGFLYSTTDLAAMDYRVHELHANRIVYVVDARQSFHFKQLFVVGKKAGFAENDTTLEHSSFGTMMNEDGRPFKTRDGGVVKLIDLINEAKLRAYALVSSRNPSWSEAELQALSEVLAIGAIKYADLSKNRSSDYIFSFDKMLAFEGNTAPYLLYAYTRIQSILKKAHLVDSTKLAAMANIEDDAANVNIIIKEPAEHKLGLMLAKFPDMLHLAAKDDCPHYVCQYVYALATTFMQFYESCPILNADEAVTRNSRLLLASKTASILQVGLNLLGIETVEKM